MADNWDTYAARMDGRTITLEGIECKVEIPQSRYRSGYGTVVNAHPTARGKRTAAYRAKRAEYRDDWSFCFDGELPPAFNRLLDS